MKNKLALVLCLVVHLSYAQEISPSPGGNSVCPGITMSYSVSLPNSNCGSPNWTITNGKFKGGVTAETGTSVDVIWDDVAKIGVLKVTITCDSETFSDEEKYVIRSLKDVFPTNAQVNYPLRYCESFSVTLRVDDIIVPNTGGTSSVPLEYADEYHWTLPTGWKEQNTGQTGSFRSGSPIITVVADNVCRGGTATVKGAACTFSYSNTVSFNLNRIGFSSSLPAPSGYTGPSCGNKTPVTFTAASLTCAQNYRWTYPTGWKGPGGATGSFTTSENSITLTPSGTPDDNGAIAVDINISCGTLRQAYNLPQYKDPGLEIPVFQSTSTSVLCSNGAGTLTINSIDGAGSYSWYAVSGGTFYVNGQTTSSTNPLITTSTNVSVSVPYLSSTTKYDNQVFVKANRANGCQGSPEKRRDVWAGLPKAPGALDISLSPICPGQVKIAQFSSLPQGANTIELINPNANFDVFNGYTGLTVEAFYPVSYSTSFTHRQTNICGITNVPYFIKVLDYDDWRCGGGTMQQMSATVYPNPTSDVIAIEMDNWEDEAGTMDVFLVNDRNEHAAELKAVEQPKCALPVSHLPEGLYTLKLRRSGNEYHQRIVIRR